MMEQASKRPTIPSRLPLIDDGPSQDVRAFRGLFTTEYFGHFQLDLSPTADEAIARLHETPYDTGYQ